MQSKFKSAGAIAYFVLGSFTLAWGDSIVIPPSKDASLYEEGGGIANGAGQHLFCGDTAVGVTRRGLLAFDVAGSIPSGSTIDSVVLTLNLSRTRFGTNAVSIHRVTTNWSEGPSNPIGQEGQGTGAAAGDATWQHTNLPGAFWTNPGGDFGPVPSATQNVGGLGSYSWGSTAGMVADVQDWLDNPASNFGWIVIGNEGTVFSAKRFDTRQHPTASLRPRLTINYTPPFVDPCPNDDPDDTDGDGVCDSDDVCPGGDDNMDADGDGVPNACDPCPQDNPDDTDGDGVCDATDPCAGSPNVDADGDGFCDSIDPCTGFPNLDDDGDGVCDGADPCIGFPNVDSDGDVLCDSSDPCQGFPNVDADGDGVCNSSDLCAGSPNVDADADGVCDSTDPCTGTPNVDADQDGLCDSIDPCTGFPNLDADGDGICDGFDPCFGVPNVDSDGDGVCDANDPCPLDAGDDSDGDGVCDGLDRCPGQDDGDFNGNGTPDCLEFQGIPTVSTWGAIVLALYLLTAAKLSARRGICSISY